MTSSIPVIAIDGPSASGKGTVSQRVAQQLGWHLLDSGALYRLVALAAKMHTVALNDVDELSRIAQHLDAEFLVSPDIEGVEVELEGKAVGVQLRSEEIGNQASHIASLQSVRDALLERQRGFRQEPGLVADGRDMGSVVFPHAELKVYLTASAEERAKRRYKQLIAKGLSVNLADLLGDVVARDKRDSERKAAPLKPAADAIVLDTTDKSIDEVVTEILSLHRECQSR